MKIASKKSIIIPGRKRVFLLPVDGKNMAYSRMKSKMVVITAAETGQDGIYTRISNSIRLDVPASPDWM